jgi:hypothetical protein
VRANITDDAKTAVLRGAGVVVSRLLPAEGGLKRALGKHRDRVVETHVKVTQRRVKLPGEPIAF